MQKLRLAAGLLGLSGVALGAFGAHALKDTLASREMNGAWETATLYQLVHTVAIWATATSSAHSAKFARAAWAWVLGVVLFSGSLYALALGGPRWLGPITPVGGVALLVGWGLIAYGALRKEDA